MRIVRVISGPHKPQVIAEGAGSRIRENLNEKYGRHRWRKMKGLATVETTNGAIVDAEIHWFEAHGHGRVEMKIKIPYGEY